MNALISECPEGFETTEKGESYQLYEKRYSHLTMTECAKKVKDSGYSIMVFDPSYLGCDVFKEAPRSLYGDEILCKISKYFVIFYQE